MNYLFVIKNNSLTLNLATKRASRVFWILNKLKVNNIGHYSMAILMRKRYAKSINKKKFLYILTPLIDMTSSSSTASLWWHKWLINSSEKEMRKSSLRKINFHISNCWNELKASCEISFLLPPFLLVICLSRWVLLIYWKHMLPIKKFYTIRNVCL